MRRRIFGCVAATVLSLDVVFTERVVSVKPLIIIQDDFATAEECAAMDALIKRCHDADWHECKEVRSKLQSKKPPKQQQMEPERPLRNSTSFQLTLEGEMESTVDTLVRRMHLMARHPIDFGEGVQVASYQEGEYYGFHHDSLMRRATLIVYLNDVPEGDGGETIFPLVRAPGIAEDAEAPLPPAVEGRERPRLDFKVERMLDARPYCESNFYLKIRPERGKAVLFYSYRPDYALDEYAIHSSCPLKRGHKSIMQRWMRFDKNSLFEKAVEPIRRARSLLGHDRLLRPATTTEVPPNTTTGAAKNVRGVGLRDGSLDAEIPPPTDALLRTGAKAVEDPPATVAEL